MPRELSRNPDQIHRRLSRGTPERVKRDFNLLVAEGLMKPLDQWDLEELARGRPRDRNGNWWGQGARPWMSALVKEEIKRRLREGTLEALSKHVPAAIRVLAEVMKSPDVDPSTRVKAATLVIEYAAGKPQTNLHIDARHTIQNMLAGALVLEDGTPAHPVIEGSIVPSDGEDDEDDRDDRLAVPASPRSDDDLPRHVREAHREGRISE